MLLLIVVSFLAAGIACIVRIKSTLAIAKQLKIRPDSQSSISGKSLMQQLTYTTVFVFVAFLLRSVFSTVYAFAHLLNDYENTTVLCPGTQWRCDPKCNNVFSHMVQWMNFTTQFQLTVVLISSPIALLVSLWGMTSDVESNEISTDQSTRINPNAAEKFVVKLRRARVMSFTQRHRHSFCFSVALK